LLLAIAVSAVALDAEAQRAGTARLEYRLEALPGQPSELLQHPADSHGRRRANLQGDRESQSRPALRYSPGRHDPAGVQLSATSKGRPRRPRDDRVWPLHATAGDDDGSSDERRDPERQNEAHPLGGLA
jgi:hypothetical protein